jgi:hypothetical protein
MSCRIRPCRPGKARLSRRGVQPPLRTDIGKYFLVVLPEKLLPLGILLGTPEDLHWNGLTVSW